MALCCLLLLSAIASPAHVFLYEYIDRMPPGWQYASKEYNGYSGKSPIKYNGTVAAWGHDANGNQKTFIAVPATN